MSKNWLEISVEEKQSMRQRFDLLHAADMLADTEELRDQEERPVRFDEIYSVATDPNAVIDSRISTALSTNASLKLDFEALLELNAICWFPVAVAAAGVDALEEREENGFSIRIRRTRAADDQVYVLIRLKEGWEELPKALVAIPNDGSPVRLTLPEEIDGVYQLIEAANSLLVAAIGDPKSRLALQ